MLGWVANLEYVDERGVRGEDVPFTINPTMLKCWVASLGSVVFCNG